MVIPVFGFFFLREVFSAQPVSSTHTIELADTHRDPETLRNAALDLAAGGKHMVLAVIQHEGEYLSSKLRRVAVAPLNEGVLAFTLDTLEESIHGGTMQQDRGARSCFPN